MDGARQVVAWHEAGHVTVALQQGLPVYHADIHPGPGRHGIVYFQEHHAPLGPVALAKVLLAGAAAEAMHTSEDAAEVVRRHPHDLGRALGHLLVRYDPPDALNQVPALLHDLRTALLQPESWGPLVRIAEGLYARGRLSGGECAAAFRSGQRGW